MWLGLLVGGVLAALVGMSILQERARRRKEAERVREVRERRELPSEDLALPGAHETTEPPINLNEATMEELMRLPRVGPTLAERIIEGRPYVDVEHLIDVQGIGETTLDLLREHVTVD